MAPAGPGDGQHGPEEDEDGQNEGDHGGGDHVVEGDDNHTILEWGTSVLYSTQNSSRKCGCPT